MGALEDQAVRWWMWGLLAAFAALAAVFWWLAEMGKALDQDAYDFGL